MRLPIAPRRRPLLVAAMLAFLAGAAPAEAALPPIYDRITRFAAVMEKASQAAALLAGAGPIDAIEALSDGSFRFRAGRCSLPVTLSVVRNDPPMPGRVDYEAKLGSLVCTK